MVMELKDFIRKDILASAKILLETEQDGKHFALGVIDYMICQVGRSYWRRSSMKTVKNIYVIFWGNTDVKENMGISPVLTPAGQVAKMNTAFKTYFDMIKVSGSLTFTK
jgi:hypothetical protein